MTLQERIDKINWKANPQKIYNQLIAIIEDLASECCRLTDVTAYREETMSSICKDAALIAANDVLKCGAGRASKFRERMEEVILEFLKMSIDEYETTTHYDGEDDDISHTRAVIDFRLKQIWGDGFRSWEDRYNWKRAAELAAMTPKIKIERSKK